MIVISPIYDTMIIGFIQVQGVFSMKEKKKYIKAYRNLLKSHLAIALLAIALFLITMKFCEGIIDKNSEILINNLVAIITGILFSFLFICLGNVKKNRKIYVKELEKNNKILKEGLDGLTLISNMITFNVESKKSEIEILVLYKDIQLNRNLLINHNLFDSISLVGINSLYDNFTSSLLKISTKKDFIDESPNLISTIDNIIKMIEEVVALNNDEKDAFLKEKERLENLFNDKKKS